MTRRFDDPRDAFDAAGLQVFERGWLSSNNVLFPGGAEDDAVLVDSGYFSHQSQTLALVRHALGDRPLRRIVNTHLHSDHCGGNAALQASHGCEAWIPAGEVDKVRRWDRTQLTYDATGQHCPRFVVHRSLQPGTAVILGGRSWELIGSPGHDPESVVLHQRELRILVSADALWENGFGIVFPELEGAAAFDILASTLDHLATLEVDWVIPGHGRPFGDVAAAIDRARRRLESFRSAPEKHALHAAKVLLKFHLLDVGRERVGGLLAWAESVAYLQLIHQAHFSTQPMRGWLTELLRGLLRAGAVRRDGEFVCDA